MRCLRDKYALVPAFLAVRGLVKQHLDSFDFLVATELANIVFAKANQRVTSDADPGFYLKYTGIRVGTPSLEEHCVTSRLTPHDCRLRDLTYAAPIFVDIEYSRGKDIVHLRGTPGQGSSSGGGVCIGRLPVMLRSACCVLHGCDEAQLARLGECPLDPGGYFIIRGAEKVVQIQEQLSKNRMILDLDTKGHVTASVTSSTHERKSKTHVTLRGRRLYVRHNTLGDDVPLLIVLRAMGCVCAQEMVALIASGGGTGTGTGGIGGEEGAVASDDVIMAHVLGPSVEEAAQLGVFTQAQALEWIGAKVRTTGGGGGGGGHDTAAAANGGGAAANGQQVPPPGSSGGAGGLPGGSGNGGGGGSGGKGSRSRCEEARDVLASVVLAHIPVEGYDFSAKVHYICTMASRVLAASADPGQLDDRDYYGNKRLELAGQLLGLLFEDLFKRLNSELRRAADAGLSRSNRAGAFDIAKCMRSDTISHGLEHALASGNWTVKRFRMDRKGVTQVLSRLSFISALGMMTRIHSQFEKTRKVSGPRALQPSQWGMVCPSDTPEGEACGLVKNLALLTHVTTDSDEQLLKRLAFALGTHPLPLVVGASGAGRRQGSSTTTALVFLNGHVLGTHAQPERLASSLRALRRCGRLGEFVSVHTVPQRCYISSDGGRVCRPLIVVKHGQPLVTQAHCDALTSGAWTFSSLLARGLVEYLDVNEENNCLVALTEDKLSGDVTHLEIEPFTILGVVAGLIPYPHHNQSPRNTYQCAMGKQAMGSVGFNQSIRADTLLYLLVYPHKPLVTTKQIQLTGFDRLGAGQNAVVAVMSYSGYDIEDALIVSKASLDRGFGRCIVMRKHSCVRKRYANRMEDRITAPAHLAGSSSAGGGGLGTTAAPPATSASLQLGVQTVAQAGGAGQKQHHRDRRGVLDLDGIVGVGQLVQPGDIFVNKESPLNTRDSSSAPGGVPDAPGAAGLPSGGGGQAQAAAAAAAAGFRPTPAVYRGEAAVIDRVLLTVSDEGQLVIKAMARSTRVPEVGDKFSSRHGQKGVVGAVVPQRDLPFSLASGMTPDVVMNPHGFPSRMTVGKLLELVGAKASVTGLGRCADGTAFGDSPGGHGDGVAELSAALVRAGLSYDGREALVCGLSGNLLSSYVFTGPVYYQKLKHMVADKMHARARGPRLVLTRQPTEGRSRDGGLRLGEMERDCLIAYGSAALLHERLCLSSDVTDVAVCTLCGLLGYYHHGVRDRVCSSCARSGAAAGGTAAVGGTVVSLKLPYAAKLLFQELQAMNVCPRLRLDKG